MEEDVKRITVRLLPETKRQLDIALAEDQRTLQDVINELIQNYLKAHKQTKGAANE